MKLVELRPGQIRHAVAENLPLLMACGVVEYHGPHLPVGTDWLMASEVVDAVEQKLPEGCVLAPGFPLGPTGSWAAGPADGELDLDAEPFFHYVKAALAGYLAMGFRRIWICQHHQGDEGVQALCLRRAATELALEAGRREGGGAGWGRVPRGQAPKVFQRIKVAHPNSFIAPGTSNIGCGHGSYGETTFILGCRPGLVDLATLGPAADRPPWLEDSHEADQAAGETFFQACVEGWVKTLSEPSGKGEKK